MNLAVVVLLGGLWASILLPGVLRARRDHSPLNSVDSFERSMSMLATHLKTPPGRQVLVLEDPASVSGELSRARVMRRRRAVLYRLVVAVLASTTLAFLLGGGVFWAAPAVAALALAGYLGLLAEDHARRVEQSRKVRRMPHTERRYSATRPAPPTGSATAGEQRPRRAG